MTPMSASKATTPSESESSEQPPLQTTAPTSSRTQSDSKSSSGTRKLKTALTAATALVTFVGLIATTIGSVYVALRAIAPDLAPREKLGATIDHVAVEHGVSYAEYRRRMSYASEEDPRTDGRVGDMVFVRVTMAGFKERSYTMTLHMLDERGTALFAGTEPGITVSTCENISPQADEDGLSWRCWIQGPPLGTKYRIRAELYDVGLARELPPGPTNFETLLDFVETTQLSTP